MDEKTIPTRKYMITAIAIYALWVLFLATLAILRRFGI